MEQCQKDRGVWSTDLPDVILFQLYLGFLVVIDVTFEVFHVNLVSVRMMWKDK